MRNLINCLLFLTFFSIAASGQEQIDTSVLEKIKDEGLNHSQVDRIAHYITDVAGSRLTNSPGYIRASNWAVSEMKSWGLANAHLDSWGSFGPGWDIKKNYVAIKKPYYQTLIAYPGAWTRGTGGLVSADVVIINALNADSIRKYNYDVKGKAVLVRAGNTMLVSPFTAFASRFSDDSLKKLGDTYMISPGFFDTIRQYVAIYRNGVAELQKRGAAALLEIGRAHV